jgi:hypothetical protein
MAIATLTSNETGANSLIDINANFADLDTTKADLASPTFTGTPTLPTGTIATTQSASDNSTKVATTAYVDAAIPTTRTCLTLIPRPTYVSNAAGSPAWSSNTTGYTMQMVIPTQITVNKISFVVDSTPTDGQIKIGIYSENGQTQEIAATSGTLSATGVIETITLGSPVTLSAGVHYVVIVPVGTASIGSFGFGIGTGMTILNPVTSEPKMYGTQVVTAGTLPTTFTPSSLTDTVDIMLPYLRLDN